MSYTGAGSATSIAVLNGTVMVWKRGKQSLVAFDEGTISRPAAGNITDAYAIPSAYFAHTRPNFPQHFFACQRTGCCTMRVPVNIFEQEILLKCCLTTSKKVAYSKSQSVRVLSVPVTHAAPYFGSFFVPVGKNACRNDRLPASIFFSVYFILEH